MGKFLNKKLFFYFYRKFFCSVFAKQKSISHLRVLGKFPSCDSKQISFIVYLQSLLPALRVPSSFARKKKVNPIRLMERTIYCANRKWNFFNNRCHIQTMDRNYESSIMCNKPLSGVCLGLHKRITSLLTQIVANLVEKQLKIPADWWVIENSRSIRAVC